MGIGELSIGWVSRISQTVGLPSVGTGLKHPDRPSGNARVGKKSVPPPETLGSTVETGIIALAILESFSKVGANVIGG